MVLDQFRAVLQGGFQQALEYKGFCFLIITDVDPVKPPVQEIERHIFGMELDLFFVFQKVYTQITISCPEADLDQVPVLVR